MYAHKLSYFETFEKHR